MPQGVRRPDEVSTLGLSHRLLVRMGALLKKRVALTVPLLESAKPGSALETALLSPSFLEGAAALETGKLPEIFGDAAASIALTAADDGVAVICLREELEAADGWGAPAEPPPARVVDDRSHALDIARPRDTHSRPANEPGGLFNPAEMDRLRLRLATATAPNDRIEALRVLNFAPLSQQEKAEILLVGLSDKDASVRAEAAVLLPSLGCDADVAEALAALNHPEASRRIAGAERLRRLLESPGRVGSPVRDLETGAIAVCALSTLKAETDKTLVGSLVDLLAACAPVIGRHAERLAELARTLTNHIAATAVRGSQKDLDGILNPAQKLLRSIGEDSPAVVFPILKAERDRSTHPTVEAFLLQLLLDLPPASPESETELIAMGAAFIARDKVEGRDSRAIGARLARRGDAALTALCDRFQEATPGAQKYLLLLLDEICRLTAVSTTAKQRATGVVLQALETGTKSLRMAAMECRFVADGDLPAETRRALAQAFLQSISDFVFPFDIEKVEATLARMGLPALDPLLERLAFERPAAERVRAVRLIGELAATMKAPAGQMTQMTEGLTQALRKLRMLTVERNFPDAGELLCALGKLAGCPAVSKEADDVLSRTLLDAAQTADAKALPKALEGLSWLAASRRAPAEVVSQTYELLRLAVESSKEDVGAREKTLNGELVIEITGGEQYTNLLPVALKGIERIACAPGRSPTILRQAGQFMVDRLKRIQSGELVWGPAISAALTQAVSEMACQPAFPHELRLEVLRCLAPRHTHPPTLRAITRILAAEDSPALAVSALSIGLGILARRDADGQFETEDREVILKSLSRVAGRANLGSSSHDGKLKTESFRKTVIEELFKGLRDRVPAAFEALVTLRDGSGLPVGMRADLEKRLREYHALSTR